MSALLIFGAGGHGNVVADTARSARAWTRMAFVDDLFPGLDRVNDIPVLANLADGMLLQTEYPDAVIAIGNNIHRLELLLELASAGFHLPSIIHPRATVAESAFIGDGCVVFAGTVIQPSVTLGRASIVNTSVSIDHDCRIGQAVHMSPGVHLGGDVQIGDHSWLGIGVSVVRGVSIGRNSIIGAGAAVIDDVEDNVKVAGVPARVIGKND